MVWTFPSLEDELSLLGSVEARTDYRETEGFVIELAPLSSLNQDGTEFVAEPRITTVQRATSLFGQAPLQSSVLTGGPNVNTTSQNLQFARFHLVSSAPPALRGTIESLGMRPLTL